MRLLISLIILMVFIVILFYVGWSYWPVGKKMFSKPLLQVDLYDIINFRNKIHSWIYQIRTKNYSPETYFDKPALELARAIRKSDLAVIRRQAPHLDLNHIYKEGMTFLFYAMLCKQPEAVTELIKDGANPQQERQGYGSPLDLAVNSHDSKYLAAMLDAGVSPDVADADGTPWLFEAAGNCSGTTLKLLVGRGANVNATSKTTGATAVYDALTSGCYDEVEYLIEHGTRVDMTLVNGVTLAYSLQWILQHTQPGTPAYEKLMQIKRMMEARGASFPADPPPVVMARMKAQGLKVVEEQDQSKQEEAWSARIVDYGIYSATQGERIKDENVAGGLTVTSGKKLIKETDQIETSMGNSFGFRYILEGPDDSAYVTIKVKHPMLKDPETGKEFTTSEWGQRVPTHSVNWNTGWVFDHDRAMMPGEWTMQLFVDGQMLLEKKFTVVTRKDKFPINENPSAQNKSKKEEIRSQMKLGRSDLEKIRKAAIQYLESSNHLQRKKFIVELQKLPAFISENGVARIGFWAIQERNGTLVLTRIPPLGKLMTFYYLELARDKQGWQVTSIQEDYFTSDGSGLEGGTMLIKQDDKDESRYTSFAGTVKSLVPLPKFSGTYKPMDFDPRYVVAVYVEETDRDLNSIPTGKILNIGIHSPSRLFRSSEKYIIGKKFQFRAIWNVKEKKFELYGLSADEI